jgi:hypothetical protein
VFAEMKVGSSYIVVMSVSHNAMMFFKQLNTTSSLIHSATVLLAEEYTAAFRADFRTAEKELDEIKINYKRVQNYITPLA